MSVLRIPVRVMKTLTALTVTVLSVVLVNKDSLETGQLVKVHFSKLPSHYIFLALRFGYKYCNNDDHPFIVCHQISTSVPQIPLRVMKTLFVPTPTVLTVVTVSRDSLEME